MNTLELKGINGTNPLGFLAALGAFRVATLADSSAKMGWRVDSATPHPYLQTALTAAPFAEAVCEEAKRVAQEVAAYHKIIKVPVERYREVARAALSSTGLPAIPSDTDFFAAFASDAVADASGLMVEVTKLSFSNGGSNQFLLSDYIRLASHLKDETVRQSIVDGTPVLLETTNLNWEPSANRSYALRWHDPTNTRVDPKLTNVPLHALGFLGLAALTSTPQASRSLQTVCVRRTPTQGRAFIWPIWRPLLSHAVVLSMLRSTGDDTRATLRFRSAILQVGKQPMTRYYFSPAMAL